MGVGQSKHRPTESSSSSSAAAPLSASAIHPKVDPTVVAESTTTGVGGGGCPMKNADGSYSVVPGFASLFGGRHGRHPPIAGAAATVDASHAGSDDDDVASSLSSSSSSLLSSLSSLTSSSSLSSSSSPSSSSSSSSSANDPTHRPLVYDVYSRPVPVDPTNNMPLPNSKAIARNSLPSPCQSSPLPTERVSSTIPKGGSGETWTYPSPQMFYNALVRKGKLDPETKEEDMTSVVAIHNCMNEGTWKRILQWEKVLSGGGVKDGREDGDGDDGDGGPSLTKFLGRPTDLSPKAFVKHYLFGHPLPFDRHDWTVTRRGSGSEETRDVRYVIDYYHDDVAASDDDGSGTPGLDADVGPSGGLRSLLVDVRPAAESVSEVWGRAVLMPLARRGCRSILECVLYGGKGFGPRSDFEPLPLRPSDSLKSSLGESELVWENIKRDAAMKKGVGAKDGGGEEACASESSPSSLAVENGKESTGKEVAVPDPEEDERTMSGEEAAKFADTYSRILSQCESHKMALCTCGSEDECNKAYAGMTVCVGQFMCPLQHSAFLVSLEGYGVGSSNEGTAVARVDTALEILGECVSEYDGRASVAKRQYPDLFNEVISKGRKK